MLGIKRLSRVLLIWLFDWLYNAVLWLAVGYFYLRRLMGLGPADETPRLWRYRLGNMPSKSGLGVWVHCASLGEAMAVSPLVWELKKRYPERHIVISLMNSSDLRAVSNFFGDSVTVLLPFDCRRFVRRALDRVHPTLLVTVESEIWPNLLRTCRLRSIPVHLVNARLGTSSLKKFRMLPTSWRKTFLSCYHSVQVREEVDRQQFVDLGIEPDRIVVSGHLRWNYQPPEKLLASGRSIADQLNRPIWIAASIHPEEIDQILKVHRFLRLHLRDVLLVLLPRYPSQDRSLIERSLVAQHLKYSTVETEQELSDDVERWLPSSHSVVWINRVGESARWYGLAQLALIGGSFNHSGGHNPIEAVLCDCAVFSGTRVDNFFGIYQTLINHEGCVTNDDVNALSELMLKVLTDQQARDKLRQNALECVQSQRCDLNKIIDQFDLPA